MPAVAPLPVPSKTSSSESSASSSTDDRVRVLITGFGPFGPYDNSRPNPSWQAVKALQGTTEIVPATPADRPLARSRPVSVTAIECPVAYREAQQACERLHGLQSTDGFEGDSTGSNFDLFLHLGVGRPNAFYVEARAHRYDYSKVDVEGELPPVDPRNGSHGLSGPEWDNGVEADEKPAYTAYDVDRLVHWLKEQSGCEVLRSDDPGRFLCEFIFHTSMAASRRIARTSGRVATPVLFVHVPPEGEPYSRAETAAFVKLLLYALVNFDFCS